MRTDFNELGLLSIWKFNCKKGNWGCSEDTSLVAARRVARQKGTKGFGNARSVRNQFDQAVSYAKLRYLKSGDKKKGPWIVVEDVIGERPSLDNIPELKRAMDELEAMAGLNKVKQGIRDMVELARNNYDHELRGEKIDEISLNRLFMGNPGRNNNNNNKNNNNNNNNNNNK